MFRMLLLFLLGFFSTSCIHSPRALPEYREADLKTTDVHISGVVQRPVIVDLDVSSKKKTITMTKTNLSIQELKDLALYTFIENHKADIIVEPMYQVVIRDEGTTVVLKGFPAKYKNFRSAKKDDLEIIKAGLSDRTKVTSMQSVDNIVTEEKKKSRIAPIALFLGGGIVLFLFILSVA